MGLQSRVRIGKLGMVFAEWVTMVVCHAGQRNKKPAWDFGAVCMALG